MICRRRVVEAQVLSLSIKGWARLQALPYGVATTKGRWNGTITNSVGRKYYGQVYNSQFNTCTPSIATIGKSGSCISFTTAGN